MILKIWLFLQKNVKKNIYKKIKPTIIHFEHGLKDGVMHNDKFHEVITFLRSNNYEIMVESYDVIAYQSDVLYPYSKI